MTYDANRRLTSIRRPNGVVTEYAYAADSALSGITETGGGVDASIVLTRDDAGRITSAARNLPTTPVLATSEQVFAYDAAHQRDGVTHDGLGRPVTDGQWTYSWDQASRLTSIDGPGGLRLFNYDAFGQMISGEQNYVWNYAFSLPVIAVVRQGEADLRYYVYFPNGAVLYSIEASDNSRHFYHFDEVGNTVFLTGDDGGVTDSYGVTPYGEVVTRSGNTENPFTFLGAYGVKQIAGTSLFYMRQRWYDGTAARFLTTDPLFLPDPLSINPYQYARANPLRFVDPTGLAPGGTGDPFEFEEITPRVGITYALGAERKTLLRASFSQFAEGLGIGRVFESQVPDGRDVWALLSQAPGVQIDRINVGGNESGQQSTFVGTGSARNDNAFAVDGVVITDMSAIGASPTQYDFDQFEEMQLSTGGADVTKSAAGVSVNLVTKRGTNEFRGSGRFLLTDDNLFDVFHQSVENQVAAGMDTQNVLPGEIEAVMDQGLELGGPIIKDRLWIWGAYGEMDVLNLVPGGLLDKTKLEDTNSNTLGTCAPAVTDTSASATCP